MENLKKNGIDEYLLNEANNERPILGICLGMQLLASKSQEGKQTQGLSLIPGFILPLPNNETHTGWNTIKFKNTKYFASVKRLNNDYYFNHGFYFSGSEKHIYATTTNQFTFAAVIRHKNILGIQFHPEKSQLAGQQFLKQTIEKLVHG